MSAHIAGSHRFANPALCVAVALVFALPLVGCITEGTGLAQAKPDMARAAELNTQLGVSYAREGDLALARKKLEQAVRQRDDYAPAHVALAYVYAQTGAAAAAEQEYRRALKLAPNDPDTQNNFGAFLCANGEGDKARAYFQRALANPDYATPAAAWTNAGVCARKQKHDDVAQQDFTNALRADPKFAQAIEQLALLSFDHGQYARAQMLERQYAAVAHPGPEMLLLSARTERALGNAARARAIEVQLIQIYPQSPQAAQVSEPKP
ncbi:MAG: type IV pilus biogenesis/stability protein PilW [Nevskiaceae bacterium]|nr:MAG: type IV pilus biogenesis/stability protein PilW [Nevskiaceae bacterium]TBR73671.1 MAG: type IV pilus biogenesis/stability protein PilW [Nevskiaceae bacterium]